MTDFRLKFASSNNRSSTNIQEGSGDLGHRVTVVNVTDYVDGDSNSNTRFLNTADEMKRKLEDAKNKAKRM